MEKRVINVWTVNDGEKVKCLSLLTDSDEDNFLMNGKRWTGEMMALMFTFIAETHWKSMVYFVCMYSWFIISVKLPKKKINWSFSHYLFI